MTAIAIIYFVIGLSCYALIKQVKQSDSTTRQQKIDQFFTIVFLWPIIAISASKYKK
jgi:nitrogen fixation/metabolism regulation signal transduction histidine kinase